MKKLPLRCGVIGAGQMGRNHARVYSEIAKLAAVADIDVTRAQSLTHEFGGKAYRDFEEMIAQEQLDAVSIVVPTTHHYSVAQKTLEAQLPTLLEKPIASTVDEACQLASLAQKKKTVLMIGQVERFNPAVAALRKLVDQKELGEIITIVATRVGVAPPKAKNSDVSLDLAIHDVDIIVSLLQKVPRAVHKVSHQIFTDQKADSASLLLDFDTASAVITTNWITPIKIRTLEVTGTKGFASLDYVNQTVTVYDRKTEEVPTTYDELVALANPLAHSLKIKKQEPLQQELLYFLQQKQWSRELEEQVDRAIRALEILLQ